MKKSRNIGVQESVRYRMSLGEASGVGCIMAEKTKCWKNMRGRPPPFLASIVCLQPCFSCPSPCFVACQCPSIAYSYLQNFKNNAGMGRRPSLPISVEHVNKLFVNFSRKWVITKKRKRDIAPLGHEFA